ncbi:MAG TPA: glycoside hydrolase 43 family protein [Candidatus Acidoferrum sp.]|nr:glycoside hydrolase 43 family protein [Candidatus Acidoferrum sp.]
MPATPLPPHPPSAAGVTPGAYPWVPDQGDGTFRNPILCADYSDPDVIRHGEDFYLTASSMNCTPGLPILHSKDLVNWQLINHAVKNLPHPRYAEVQPGCGVWAPALRFHAGKFWIFFPTPDEGIYVTTATDPAGRWSEPQLVHAGRGLIDPCPLWDDDGRAYLVHAYAKSRAGIRDRLRICPMAPDGSGLLGEGRIVFHDPVRHPILEGPKFHRQGGWYYLLAPAGGVETGWQVVLRSRSIYGPYVDRVVLEQGRTAINGPHQGALVDTPEGEFWFVHFQDAGVYGRIVHLQPVRWQDGWPLMGVDQDGNGVGEPVLHCAKPSGGKTDGSLIPQTSDEFDSARLGLQWQWQANHQDGWYSLTSRPGWLRLHPQPMGYNNLAQVPNLLLQKFPARSFRFETKLEFSPGQAGEEAGLVVNGQSSAALALRHDPEGTRLILRVDEAEKTVRGGLPETLKLRVEVADGGRCTFSFASGEAFELVPGGFQAQKGTWMGAKVGIYALAGLEPGLTGTADFDYCRFA